MTDLETDLLAWDMKSVPRIKSIYRRHGKNNGFDAEVVRLTGLATFERGATWLLKHHLIDRGETIRPEILQDIYASLTGLNHWEAKLHFLQCLTILPIPQSETRRVERFLDTCLGDDAKFVRAWAYSGLHRLAVQFPEYRPKVMSALQAALLEETSAAVKVRVRKAIEAGF